MKKIHLSDYIFSLSIKLFFVTVVFIFIANPITIFADSPNCSSGYTYKPSSGVGCIQIGCNDIPDAHYGYTGYCVCGSSGSINENPKDPNTECTLPKEHTACSGCVYACVGTKETCPDTTKIIEGQNRCVSECEKLKNDGSDLSKVLESSGIYPNCNCAVDVVNDKGQLIKTVNLNKGDQKTTYTFNPQTGVLITKDVISIKEEIEKIRQQLGFKYTDAEIDALIENDKMSSWFQAQMQEIKTNTHLYTPSFWWQHILALFDHGFGNSADFVDTYKFGRCGDSMLWLERELEAELDLGEKRQEAFLSITGENYGNITNHTAIMIRPQGITSLDWAEMVQIMLNKSGGDGLTKDDIKTLDPALLTAKVIDPYFKKEMTVEQFISGWSVIRIS